MKKVEFHLPSIHSEKRTMEIAMQITRKKRRLASGNPSLLFPANGELNTPSPPLFLHSFASQLAVG